jgi:3-hydroxy-D-aspartate aldolase
MIQAPAVVGMHVRDIDTPALVIDLDALEANIARMSARMSGTGVSFRPHSKTHKSTAIAAMQLRAGAVGVCCQKVSEAEIMVAGGVRDVFVTNEIVGAPKVARLAALARHARVSVCVDALDNVAALKEAAERCGSVLHVLVELNVGANRCGVDTIGEVLSLAREVVASGSLRFAGVQAYHGPAQHFRAREERRAAIGAATAKAREAVALLLADGIECAVVAGAGTGSHEFELASGLYTEVQVGSYVFMDADYGRNLDEGGRFVSEFANALFVLATVMSGTAVGRRVVDAGTKALSTDSGMPVVHGFEGVSYVQANDEHGRLEVAGDAGPAVGEKIRIIPGHVDPTVNLHDWYVGLRGERVECVWPVSTRGALF